MSNPRRIPVSLLDSSPFESREEIFPLETVKSLGVIVPVLVRPKEGGRFEVVAGHRRVESARRAGLKTVLCAVKHLDDRKAAVLHFTENTDRAELSALAKGRFFQRFMKRFAIGEREAARILGVSHSQISLCVGLSRTSEAVVRGLTAQESESLEPVITMTKYAAVSGLPMARRVEVLREAVRRRLSDSETKRVVTEVKSGNAVERAVGAVVDARKARRQEVTKTTNDVDGRLTCLRCGRPVTIEHVGNRRHRVLAEVMRAG